MSSDRSTVGDKFELDIPDEYCVTLDINIGNILLLTSIEGQRLSIEKHSEQHLSDTEI